MGHRTQESAFLIIACLFLKDATEEQPDGRDALGRVCAGHAELPALPPSQHLDVFADLAAL